MTDDTVDAVAPQEKELYTGSLRQVSRTSDEDLGLELQAVRAVNCAPCAVRLGAVGRLCNSSQSRGHGRQSEARLALAP